MPRQENSLILLNDFQAQWEVCREKALAAIERVGRSGWYVLGEEVKKFEARLANLWGLRYAVGCGNGLDAIEIGLRTLGIQPGDLVLTTPLSAFATTLAIVRAGGTPVFSDVDESGLIDLALAEECLKEFGTIRFFVPVHLYGHALPPSKLAQFKRKHGLKVVEDCAQSIGVKNCGSSGDLAATSFYPTKNLGCMGDGGALLTDDPELAAKARSLRDYGQSEKYVHSELGLNSRLDELQAALLHDALLPHFEDFSKRRALIADRYLSEIRHPQISFPKTPKESAWHLFPVLIQERREAFQNHLLSRKILTAKHYPLLIPRQKALRLFFASGSLSQAQRFADCEVSLPIHPFLTDGQVDTVIEACNGWSA